MRRSRSEERSGDRINERRNDIPDQHHRNDRWAVQPSGDSHSFVPLTVSEGQQQKGRHFSNQEDERCVL